MKTVDACPKMNKEWLPKIVIEWETPGKVNRWMVKKKLRERLYKTMSENNIKVRKKDTIEEIFGRRDSQH